MAESKLDIIIDPRHALDGAKRVEAALLRMGSAAQKGMAALDAGVARVRTSLFSLNTLIAGIAITGLARQFVETARSMDRMERSLQGVMTSSGAARVEFERLRKIASQFQIPDEDVVEGFRLLASNYVPNAEKAIKVLSNVALDANKDLSQVVTGLVRVNPKILQQLGVESVELATGKIVLGFRGVRREVQNTDEVIRATLIEMFEKTVPDASQRMANSVDHQFKRMIGSWDDFTKAILDAGLQDFLAATFKEIADSFEGDTMEAKAKKAADGIQATLKTIARDVAVVLDTLTPLGNLIFSTINHALSAFNKLPPGVQALGIIGYLYFGTVGRVVLISSLALLDAIGVKLENTQEWINRARGLGVDLVSGTPLGLLAKKGSEAVAGKKFPKQFSTRPDLMQEVTPEKFTFGDGSEDANKDKRTFLEIVDEKIKKIEERTKAEQAQRDAIKATAEAERQAGKTGQKEPTLNKNDEAVTGILTKLRQETKQAQELEEKKRDRLVVPEALEAEAKATEFINGLRAQKLVIEKDVEEEIRKQFKLQSDAVRQTRQWNEETQLADAAAERKNQFLEQTNNLLRDATDATDALNQEEGVARRAAEISAEMIRKVEADRIPIDEKVLKLLLEMPKALAEQERINANILFQEQRRKDHLDEIATLQDQIADAQKGLTTQSLDSRVNAQERAAKRANVDFDRGAETERQRQVMDKQKELTLTRVNQEIEREYNLQADINRLAGKNRQDREAELMFIQKKNELQQQGIELSPAAEFELRGNIRQLQEQKQLGESATAFNNFVDSFEVGWQQIERMGEQAYSHLEDGLLDFIQTGKLNFSSFADFVSQELIRLGMRAAISQAFGSIGGSQGLSSLFNFGSLFGGNTTGGGGGGGGSQAGNFSTGGAGIGFTTEQRGGIVDYHGEWPIKRFQQGGINTHQRLISISEGHTPEAIIPLRGGKVPVEMKGQRGVSINAPITILTPDAHGVRRSVQQVQAELSSTMTRAARRIN